VLTIYSTKLPNFAFYSPGQALEAMAYLKPGIQNPNETETEEKK